LAPPPAPPVTEPLNVTACAVPVTTVAIAIPATITAATITILIVSVLFNIELRRYYSSISELRKRIKIFTYFGN
jgi:hypothetical protein